MELVSWGGHTFFAPAWDKDQKINNVCKWDTAFRVYAAVYSEANPSCAAEIWQYIYVIHKAATNYQWDNVAFYDFTFRQLMARKPWRSWSKTLTQAWNLAMTDPVSKGGNNSKTVQSAPHNNSRSWKDDCCWKFNKNKCPKTAHDCNYDHRCTYCGGWNHGFYNCHKRLHKRSSGGDGRGSSAPLPQPDEHVNTSSPPKSQICDPYLQVDLSK